MDLLGDMHSLEDLFDTLGVAYDPLVLSVHRMRILRRFGLETEALRAESLTLGVVEYRRRCGSVLGTIHEQCRLGLREPVPVFRGLSSQLVQLRRKPAPSRV